MKLKLTKGDDVQEGKKFDLQDFMNTLNTLDPQSIGLRYRFCVSARVGVCI